MCLGPIPVYYIFTRSVYIYIYKYIYIYIYRSLSKQWPGILLNLGHYSRIELFRTGVKLMTYTITTFCSNITMHDARSAMFVKQTRSDCPCNFCPKTATKSPIRFHKFITQLQVSHLPNQCIFIRLAFFLPFFRITHHGFTIFPSLPCSVFPSSTFVGGHPNVPGEHLLPGLKASEYLGVSTVCQLGGFSIVGSFGFFQR